LKASPGTTLVALATIASWKVSIALGPAGAGAPVRSAPTRAPPEPGGRTADPLQQLGREAARPEAVHGALGVGRHDHQIRSHGVGGIHQAGRWLAPDDAAGGGEPSALSVWASRFTYSSAPRSAISRTARVADGISTAVAASCPERVPAVGTTITRWTPAAQDRASSEAMAGRARAPPFHPAAPGSFDRRMAAAHRWRAAGRGESASGPARAPGGRCSRRTSPAAPPARACRAPPGPPELVGVGHDRVRHVAGPGLVDVDLHHPAAEHRLRRHGLQVRSRLRRIREMPLAVHRIRGPLLQDVEQRHRASNAAEVAAAAGSAASASTEPSRGTRTCRSTGATLRPRGSDRGGRGSRRRSAGSPGRRRRR